ncbi:MAG: UDP-N-acetylmuramate--L-alanine ligase [Oscillatoriales cyanobacterium SM2_1_8]|nr:UDP-N-acetylmuramate--L-alanine ligase [Oscillatoriales cyanobacterium SM2_1_8]
MLNSIDFSGRPFHFIGIGGIGMSAIAHILIGRGCPVSGSDISCNGSTNRLQDLGITIYKGHHADHIDPQKSPQVVYSSAIDTHNPELETALRLGLPVFHRSDLLAALIAQTDSIAVAGTHGKTTTSSLIGFLLLKAGLDPSIVVGGEVNAWQGNARLGNGPLVAEADESDGSFVKFSPKIGVVTNIELDHPDRYGSLAETVTCFREFAGRCQRVVGCLDDGNVREHLRSHIGYSLENPGADYFASEVRLTAGGTQATIWERGEILGTATLTILGKHNLSNALAAIAVVRQFGVPWTAIEMALPEFVGARRRFEVRGTEGGITFVDDYAHHPSEVQVTLAAAKLQQRRVVAVFQPHRYSRTKQFLGDFAQAFGHADVVLCTEVYSAGEAPNGHWRRASVGGDRRISSPSQVL